MWKLTGFMLLIIVPFWQTSRGCYDPHMQKTQPRHLSLLDTVVLSLDCNHKPIMHGNELCLHITPKRDLNIDHIIFHCIQTSYSSSVIGEYTDLDEFCISSYSKDPFPGIPLSFARFYVHGKMLNANKTLSLPTSAMIVGKFIVTAEVITSDSDKIMSNTIMITIAPNMQYDPNYAKMYYSVFGDNFNKDVVKELDLRKSVIRKK